MCKEIYESLKDAEKEVADLKKERFELKIRLKQLEEEYFNLAGKRYEFKEK